MELVEIVKIPEIEQLVFKPVDLSNHTIDGGIYRMFDSSGQVIYVGKSSNLRVRVNNHLHHRTHTAYFMDEVEKIQWFQEPDPIFETLLESIFIAYHQPKYNDEVKDHKKKFGETDGK
jgi:excinuclease UvrABC nuclease subunit